MPNYRLTGAADKDVLETALYGLDINDFDWEDLRQLVRQTQTIQPDRITAACLQGYAFLAELDPAERVLADDLHQRDHATWRMLRNNLPTSRT